MHHPTPNRQVLLKPGFFPVFSAGAPNWPAWVRRSVALGGALLLVAASQPEMHAFTEAGGQTYPAEVVLVKNGEVVVKRADGKAYSLDVQSLTVADREYVRGWKPAADQPRDALATTESDIAIKITLEAVVAAAPNPRGPGLRSPKVILINRETKLNFKGLKGTLVLIGQQPGPAGRYKVIGVQTFAVDLDAVGRQDYSGAAIPESVASITPGLAPFHYQGYLFVLQNSENNIIQFQRLDVAGKTADEALKLKLGDTFSQRRPVGRAPARNGARAVPSALPLGG